MTGVVPRHALGAGALLAISAALALGGCASDPPTRFHSLLAAEPARDAMPAASPTASAAVSAAVLANSAPIVISLAAVRVPAQVDQPQWLVRLPDGSLQLLEQDRWAAPLRDEFQAALLEALSVRWGVVDSRTAPERAATAWRLVVDVTRFESILGREARLDVRWSLVAPTAATIPAPSAAPAPAPTAAAASPVAQLACATTLREPAETPVALAQGHQRAVVRLADAIGLQLRSLARGQSAACPAVALP